MVVACPCLTPVMVCPGFFPATSVYAGSSKADLEKGREVDDPKVPLLSNRHEFPPGYSRAACLFLCFIVLITASTFLFLFNLSGSVNFIQLPVVLLFCALLGINGVAIFMMWWGGTFETVLCYFVVKGDVQEFLASNRRRLMNR